MAITATKRSDFERELLEFIGKGEGFGEMVYAGGKDRVRLCASYLW